MVHQCIRPYFKKKRKINCFFFSRIRFSINGFAKGTISYVMWSCWKMLAMHLSEEWEKKYCASRLSLDRDRRNVVGQSICPFKMPRWILWSECFRVCNSLSVSSSFKNVWQLWQYIRSSGFCSKIWNKWNYFAPLWWESECLPEAFFVFTFSNKVDFCFANSIDFSAISFNITVRSLAVVSVFSSHRINNGHSFWSR